MVEHAQIDFEFLGDLFAFGELFVDLLDVCREQGDGAAVFVEEVDLLFDFFDLLLHGVEHHAQGGESRLAVHAGCALFERGVERRKMLPVVFEIHLLRREALHRGLFADEFGFSR